MNEELKKLLLHFLKTTLGIDEAEASKLFKEDGTPVDGALDKLKVMDVDRIKLLKEEATTQFNNGHKKGQSEALGKLEADIRAKYSITSDNKGIELIEELVTAHSKAGSKETTEEAVKKHPAYQKLQLEKESEIAAKVKEVSDQFESFKSSAKKREIFDRVKSIGLTHLEGLKPILSEDAKKAANQRNVFLNELSAYDYEIGEDGEPLPMKDGKLVTNSHGHVLKFGDIATETAEKFFDFAKAEDRSSGGGDPDKKKVVKKSTIKKPGNADEYVQSMKAIINNKALNDKERAEQKDELTKLWEEAKVGA